MNRNTSNLQFQKRLINTALNAPKLESMNLFRIIYRNLKEFLEVRVTLDDDKDELMDQFFNTLEYFCFAFEKRFPTLYENCRAPIPEVPETWAPKVRMFFGDGDTLDPIAIVSSMQTFLSNYNQEDHPIGYFDKNKNFYHHEQLLRLIQIWVDEQLSDQSDRPDDLITQLKDLQKSCEEIVEKRPMREVLMVWKGDAYDVAPTPTDSDSTIDSINRVAGWANIVNQSKDDYDPNDYDIYVEFIAPDDAPNSARYLPFQATKFFIIDKYIVEIFNYILIECDEIIGFILNSIGAEVPEQLQYSDDLDEEIFPFIVDDDDEATREFFRTPALKDQTLADRVCKYIGLIPSDLQMANTIGELKALADRFEDMATSKIPFVESRRSIGFAPITDRVVYPRMPSDAWFTIYRTGKLDINVMDFDATKVEDSNLKFMIFMAALLAGHANFYVEIRARGDERNNIAICYALMKLGAIVRTTIPYNEELKVHGKLWVLGSRANQWSLEVISTGNFVETAQKQFADTVYICYRKKRCVIKTTDMINMLFGDAPNSNLLAIHDQPAWFKPNEIRKMLGQELKTLLSIGNVKGRTIASTMKPLLFIKCNHIADDEIKAMIKYAADCGVGVYIIVRTTFDMPTYRMAPIHVRSINGKYLEHDRWFWFGWAKMDENRQISELIQEKAFMSSADLMTRNLAHRVELMVEVDADFKLGDLFWTLYKKSTDAKEGFFNYHLS